MEKKGNLLTIQLQTLTGLAGREGSVTPFGPYLATSVHGRTTMDGSHPILLT